MNSTLIGLSKYQIYKDLSRKHLGVVLLFDQSYLFSIIIHLAHFK